MAISRRRFALTLAAPTALAAADSVETWTDQRVQQNLPSKEERRLDEIGWAPTVIEAQGLSAKSGRPMFVTTHDGDVARGRC